MDQKTLRKHFIECVYEVLDGVISPTPYLEITTRDNIKVDFLDGKGRKPVPDSIEATVLDIALAKLFYDDFNILAEGITGVGKTYTIDALCKTVFGQDGFYTLRLSGDLGVNSALEPFTTSAIENGMPTIKLDPEKCSKYGAIMLDEINRGDTQETFQVIDGEIHVNGDTCKLRVPIKGRGRYKKLAVFGAMNPADADHSQALELDIAGENRFLKFRFPNGVDEAASSQLDNRVGQDMHERFWKMFCKRTGMRGGWRDLYPVVTDSSTVITELDGETREFIDVALGYIGRNPLHTYERNKELIQQDGIGISFAVKKGNELDKIVSAQNALKHGFVRRDLSKIRNMSCLLGFIRSIKDDSYEPSVTLDDVAASVGVILSSKVVTGSDHTPIMGLVNDVRKAYKAIREEMNVPDGYGIREIMVHAALSSGDFDGYLSTLNGNAGRLNTQVSDVAQAVVRSRLLADMVVLDNFSRNHEADLKLNFESDGCSLADLSNIYRGIKPAQRRSVYVHRLPSVMTAHWVDIDSEKMVE